MKKIFLITVVVVVLALLGLFVVNNIKSLVESERKLQLREMILEKGTLEGSSKE